MPACGRPRTHPHDSIWHWYGAFPNTSITNSIDFFHALYNAFGDPATRGPADGLPVPLGGRDPPAASAACPTLGLMGPFWGSSRGVVSFACQPCPSLLLIVFYTQQKCRRPAVPTRSG